jgi:Pentapeptide repeats (8 copies)
MSGQVRLGHLVIIRYPNFNAFKGLAVAVIPKPFRLLPAVLAASLATTPWTAAAFDAGKMEDFKTTNVCKYCDLIDAPLGGRDMRGADFQNANLSGALLAKSNMGERPMEKRTLVTNFEDANLRRTDFSGANLHMANFTNAYLREANLSGADLSDAVLLNANMKGAVLAGTNLKGAKMDGAKLDDAKFCKTVMPDGAVNDSGC